ncbi:hypothetical protein HS041_03605 [Planomonospora sp. ID67723]|uniref:hypothetical protein n=1 Tax=Planomonospora sp. ID67723 TaxID=2738134 RepID=UPI0018C38A28|nr:hypothetical protein [Planomonospora sp. ID67723]MBG0826858.1 hypothetical protein [Planomonospora sp. ID67723]
MGARTEGGAKTHRGVAGRCRFGLSRSCGPAGTESLGEAAGEAPVVRPCQGARPQHVEASEDAQLTVEGIASGGSGTTRGAIASSDALVGGAGAGSAAVTEEAGPGTAGRLGGTGCGVGFGVGR